MNGRCRPDTRLAGVLFGLSVCTLGLAAFVLAGGRLLFEGGGVRLSVRSPWPALGIGTGLLWLASRVARCTASSVAARATTHRSTPGPWWPPGWCRTMALLGCVAVAALGVAFGHADAAGADAAGYVSQADLWRRGRLQIVQPLIEQAPWPDAAWTFSPLGYRPGPQPGTLVPTYPPGLPLHFAVAQEIGGDRALRLVVPVLGALAAWGAFLLGRRVAGEAAGLVAAVLLGTAPSFVYQLVQPMSDVPATAWWSLTLAAVVSGRTFSQGVAGFAAGLTVLTRPSLAPLLLVAWVMALVTVTHATQHRDSHDARVLATWPFVLGALPALVLLASVNTHLFGAPWRSGYGTADALFALGHVPVNLRLYAIWLLDTHGPLLLLLAVGALVCSRRWLPAHPVEHTRSELGSPSCPPTVVLMGLAATAVTVVAVYVLYAPFESWTYLRFLLPALAALAPVAACGAVWLLGLLPAPARMAALVVVVGTAAGYGLAIAYERNAFALKHREARYREAATWIRDHTPADTIVLAAQHSGSVHHIARRTVVRWDLLEPGRATERPARRATATEPLASVPAPRSEPPADTSPAAAFRGPVAGAAPAGTSDPARSPRAGEEGDAAAGSDPPSWLDVAWSGAWAPRADGSPRPVLLVLEAGEEDTFRARFGTLTPAAALDWPPWVTTAPPSPVRIYRLTDRTAYLEGRLPPPRRLGPAMGH